MEGEYQAAINRVGRATLAAFQSTPVSIVAAESKLTPAGPVLGDRQASFAPRLLAGGGPEEAVTRWSTLTDRLQKVARLRPGDGAEQRWWVDLETFPGSAVVAKGRTALEAAKVGQVEPTLCGRLALR